MKLIQEIINQSDLSKSDGSDAGTNDVKGKGAEVKFDLMRNTINSDGKVSGSSVANYLERAHELNDEVETVLYGLETSDGEVVKVYVNATQSDAFEVEMKKMLGMEDDIEEAINALATKFDIVDVIWPAGSQHDETAAQPEDDIDLGDSADIGNPDDADEDDDMETIASVDDEERGEATPPVDDDETVDDEEAPKDKKAKAEPKKTDDEESEEESADDEEAEPEDEEESAEKKDKPKKKGEKHSLLKSIGGGLAGKAKVTEGEVIKADFSRGKGADTPDIKVPKGYDRFEVDGKKIIGIKGDKKFVVSTTSDGRLAQELVRVYNGGKASTAIKPMSLLQAFGSQDLIAADEAGVKLTEKPGNWEDFEGGGYAAKRNISEIALKKLEKAVGKLKVYTGQDIYGMSKPKGPQVGVKVMPKEDMFIVKFDDGSRYVADQTGAGTYIRNWQKIN